MTIWLKVTIGNQARHNNNQRSDFVLVEAIGLLVKQIDNHHHRSIEKNCHFFPFGSGLVVYEVKKE
ncbi:hypothetical protein DERP_005154 [Dermatophagoides pteronyssinus]|uniref:Uncharacterized protein n=1 Tax=Dermatophagoides pteronyssinus TaxID=6956 RepID=A0ABQ8JLT1_DERPT|nr:hypothetical protein DERP_005154 [Dermatophagoides pteronyssinus]